MKALLEVFLLMAVLFSVQATMPDWNTWTTPPYSTGFTIPATPTGYSRNFETDKAPWWVYRRYQYAFHSG